MEYLRSRFSNIRFKAFVIGLALLYQSLISFFCLSSFFSFYIEVGVSNYLILVPNR